MKENEGMKEKEGKKERRLRSLCQVIGDRLMSCLERPTQVTSIGIDSSIITRDRPKYHH